MKQAEYRRNSLRYPGYDYSQSGAVFVTICTHNNQRLFGHVTNGTVSLSHAGISVAQSLEGLGKRFSDVLVDAFIVMPDHLHAIIMIGTDPAEDQRNTIGFIVGSFKNSVAAAWRKGVALQEWPRYDEQLWHRDYYDRIVRNEPELQAFREYIGGNPARWEAKRCHPWRPGNTTCGRGAESPAGPSARTECGRVTVRSVAGH